MKVIGSLKLRRQRSKSLKEAYPASATAPISRWGYQRLTKSSRAARPTGLSSCGACPALGRNAQREPAYLRRRARPTLQRPTGSVRAASRTPILGRWFTRSGCGWSAPYLPVDALGGDLLSSGRLWRVSSTPKTSGPSGTKVPTSNPNSSRRLTSRLDQLARLRTRW